MEADKLFLEEISDFLGPKKDRYFANGFKGIDISYHETTYQNGVFRAAIQVGSGNGWSKKKGENLTPHLGTTEFISIAAAVSQQLMERELQLSREAIECSWISRFTCKIKQCENIDCHHIPLSGSLFSTRVNEDNMYEYGFKVQIGSLLITLYVCSPRKFIPDKTDPSGKIDVYTTDMKRIALTGSPNRERTILANALSILVGFDRTLCPPYSQIAKKYDLSLDRSHCQWPDSYVYCLGAFTERVIVEQQYADHFVSDGSVLNELVWIKCRYSQVELIYEQSMIHSLEKVLAEYAANKYDFLFHIGATVTGDTSEQCLRQLFEKYNIRHQIIDPLDPESALKQMADFMEITPVLSATHTLLKVKQEQIFL